MKNASKYKNFISKNAAISNLLVVALNVMVFILCTTCNEGKSLPVTDSYKILACNPLTGTMSFVGPSLERSMTHAAAEINNAGGLINGRNLDLIYIDTHSDVSNGIFETDYYYKKYQNQVVGLAGAYLNDISRKLLANVAANQPDDPNVNYGQLIPMISPASSSPEFIEGVDHRSLFSRMVPSAYKQVALLAKKAQDLGYFKASIISLNDDNGYYLSSKFDVVFNGLGLDYTSTSHVLTDNTQVSATMDAACASNPDFLFIIANGNEGKLLLSDWARRYPHINLMLIDTLMSDSFFASLDPTTLNALNAAAVDGFFPSYDPNSMGYKSYIKGFCAAHPNDCKCPVTMENCDKTEHGLVVNFTPNAYDAVMVLALAILQTGHDNPDAINRETGWDVGTIVENISQVVNANSATDITIYPGEWQKAVEAIGQGQEIDYEGASFSPFELDQHGDPTTGYYQPWTVVDGRVVYTDSQGN